ncbi:DedA family protein [Flavisphingomonas formosensis]|uniref:DedA family protein n=1 Tax=Flavisphingomonas formosensis TaxID=861534 RepID=UPI0012F8BB62|nr:DedA family protein [Sphingomonas formosensis]
MTLEGIVTHYGLLALFLGAGIEGETVALTGGFLAHQRLVPLGWAMVAVSAGSFVADQIFFMIGRRYRDHRWVRRFTDKPAFAKAYEMLEKRPVSFVLAFRFLYGLRVVSPLAIGTSALPMRRFTPLNAIAATVWGVSFTALGYIFGSAIERLTGDIRSIGMVLIGAAIVGACLFALTYALRSRNRARPPASQ